MTPALSEWPLTRRAAQSLMDVCEELLPVKLPGHGRERPGPTPFGRGVTVCGSQEISIGKPVTVTLVADSGGVVGIARARASYDDHPAVPIHGILEEELEPLASALASVLTEAEAYGRAIIDLWLVGPPKAEIGGAVRPGLPTELHVSREITVPAGQEEIDALAASWHRELQRVIGIPKFEGEPGT